MVFFCAKIWIRKRHKTEFEIEATFNVICKPGRIVRMFTNAGKEDNRILKEWKCWTIIDTYEHHVLMRSAQGYHESFSNTDIRELIRKGEIRWR